MGNHLFPLLILLVALTSAMALIAEHKLLDANEHLAPGQVKGNRAKTLAKSVKCIDETNWSTDLTLSRLTDMTKIFMGKPFTTYVPSKTYIFVPVECPDLKTYGNVYISGNGMHAEDQMYARCGLPSDFYLTSAPCLDCAIMLKEKYNNQAKPTINIARPYIGKGKSGNGNKDVNMQCLAMLVQDGFNLVAWNWNGFKAYLTNGECQDTVNQMLTSHWEPIYNQKYLDTINVLTEVINMANNQPKGYYETQCKSTINE